MPRPEAELPSELLALIFGHNAWKIILDHGYMHIPYLSVMGVSRAWRQACLGAPHLWTSIQLRLCHQEGCPVFKRSKELFDRVIEYTGNHPLDLEIGPEDLYDWPAWFLRGPRHQDEWALRRLLFVSERWRSVHIHPSILSLVNMDTGHLPILETVSFFDTTGAPNTRDPLYSEWFQEAPELRTVYFSHRDVSLYKFPWTQLSTLSLSQSTPSDLVEISQLCSNLENLSLSRYWDDDQFIADLPVAISFLRLRKFAFDAVHVASPAANTLQFITETMLRMRCPILDHFRLEIMFFPQYTTWFYEELSHALAQFSTIQRLELRGIPCNANQMVHLISSQPSLRQLYILDRYPDSSFPTGFSDSFYDPCWIVSTPTFIEILLTLPSNLEEIILDTENISFDDLLPMLEMCEMRKGRQVDLRLRAQKMSVPRSCADALPRRERLLGRGIHLELTIGRRTLNEWFELHKKQCLQFWAHTPRYQLSN